MGLWTPVRNLPRGFRSLNLSSQFLIAAGLVLCGAMAVLGSWITTQIAQSTLKSAAVSSAAFMDLYLEPNVQVFVGQGIMPSEMAENLDRVLAGTALGGTARRRQSLAAGRYGAL